MATPRTAPGSGLTTGAGDASVARTPRTAGSSLPGRGKTGTSMSGSLAGKSMLSAPAMKVAKAMTAKPKTLKPIKKGPSNRAKLVASAKASFKRAAGSKMGKSPMTKMGRAGAKRRPVKINGKTAL